MQLTRQASLSLCFLCFASSVTAVLPSSTAAEKTCLVASYNATGDGVTHDTAAIQAAISACSASEGGGRVVFEAGKTYLTGTIRLASGVRLVLPLNSTLLASDRREDYPQKRDDWYLVLADKCRRCGIEGGGRIDGQARSWVTGSLPDRKQVRNWADNTCPDRLQCRPRLVGIRESQQVVVQDVELFDPVFWALHILHSDAVAVLRLRVHGDKMIANTDGIDIDGSKRVYVSKADIDTADDAICIKTTSGERPAESILVEDCLLRSKSSAIKIGSESRADFETINFRNIVIKDSHRGLAIQLRDGGSLREVTFANISVATRFYNSTWWGNAEPIYVTATPRTAGGRVGSVEQVSFTNVTCVAENGILLAGAPGAPLGSVALAGVSLQLKRSTKFPGGFRDYRPGGEGRVEVGTAPAIYAEYVNHATLSNVQVTFPEEPRLEWGDALGVRKHTVHALKVAGLTVHDEAAHGKAAEAPREAGLGAKALVDWVTSFKKAGGFLSMSENAAPGVAGRRAASSGSSWVILTGFFIVIIALAVNYVALPKLREAARSRAHGGSASDHRYARTAA